MGGSRGQPDCLCGQTIAEYQVYSYLLKTFSNVWELKYGNIGFVAGLVFDLQRYHPNFGVSVMDQTMENIRIGMEVCHMDRL